ncbi:MAG: cytochrome b [Pseudomonadales bacterium]
MRWANTNLGYGVVSVILHWLMFLLIVGVYACIELRELYPRGSDPREALKQWHFTLGLTVFVLAWFRIGLYLGQKRPVIVPPPPDWQQSLARIVQVLLLVVMLGMPIGGWLALSAGGEEIPFYGMHMPPLMGKDEALADLVEDVHETIGKLLYFLIGLHAAAALFHHYFQGDNTLRRMLPGQSHTDDASS